MYGDQAPASLTKTAPTVKSMPSGEHLLHPVPFMASQDAVGNRRGPVASISGSPSTAAKQGASMANVACR